MDKQIYLNRLDLVSSASGEIGGPFQSFGFIGFSPDGSQLFFEAGLDDADVLMGITTSETPPRPVQYGEAFDHEDGGIHHAELSPDGKTLAFTRSSEIYSGEEALAYVRIDAPEDVVWIAHPVLWFRFIE